MIRIALPYHLRTLARIDAEVRLDVPSPVTQRSVLDALEARYLCSPEPFATMKLNSAGRFCGFLPAEKICPLSHRYTPLPDKIASGEEPFLVIGAIAGG